LLVLRPERRLTARGGHGMAIKLYDMTTDATVWWSPKHKNSFVAEERDGQFYVVSINGIGEIRWVIPAEDGFKEYPFGGEETASAVSYFFDRLP